MSRRRQAFQYIRSTDPSRRSWYHGRIASRGPVNPARSPSRKEHPMSDESAITIVQIPFPESGDPQLRITVGPAKLRIAPGDGAEWVSGTYHDPSHRVPCRVA